MVFLKNILKCPLFFGIKENDLGAMLGCLDAKVRSFEDGEAVIREGDRAGVIGIVLSGAVTVERVDYHGNKSIVGRVSENGMFAESYACAGITEIPVTVVAAEKSEIMLADVSKMLYTCKNSCAHHNRLVFNLMKIIAQKNLVLNQKNEIMSAKTTRDKLLLYLETLVKRKGPEITVPFDRQGLADFLGVDRSGLSAEISKLRAEGVLECRKNRFRLL